MHTLPMPTAIEEAKKAFYWPFVKMADKQCYILFTFAPRRPGEKPDASFAFAVGNDGFPQSFATVEAAASALKEQGIETFFVEAATALQGITPD